MSAIKAFQDEVNFRTFARSSLSPKKRDSESPTRQKDFASVLQQQQEQKQEGKLRSQFHQRIGSQSSDLGGIYQTTQQAQKTLDFKGGDLFADPGKNTVVTDDGRITFERQSFHWLLEHLLAPNDKICGCELWVPDTAFFEGGKPKLIVKTDKEGFLVAQRNKMNLLELRRTFSNVVRERKKEFDPFAEGMALLAQIQTTQ